MQAKWNIKQLSAEQQSVCKQLARDLNISEMSARLLITRGITTADHARRFIRPNLQELHNPFLMKDMDKAVARLQKAVDKGERILVYGDYDVDGTTAVALVYRFLSKIYGEKGYSQDKIDYYIPDRYTEGYGISFQGIDYASSQDCTLIVALDCGIKSVDKVEYATEKGIDFIICDHHMPDATIPNAVAVLDAKRVDSTYPYNELSGCGVGFKFVQAYAQKAGISFDEIVPLLELVAMSIASDIVPITDENRILAHFGIKQIQTHPSVGVEAILNIANVEKEKLNISDLVYRVGPRINACGRIHTGRDAVKLLITQDMEEASNMSATINQSNTERKGLDEQITQEALQMLDNDPLNTQHTATVVCGKDWHKGVIGIVASRLTETYFRPTIVLTEADGMVSGSARSVGGFDIYSAIDSCRELLTNFGGHPFAAGLAMKVENYPIFKERFEQYVATHILPEQQQPIVEVETEICFEDITNDFYRVIRCLEPFGPGNPRPVFVTRNICNYRYTKAVGKENKHLRLDITDRTGYMSGIAFGMGHYALDLQNGKNMDVCYELGVNTYNGKSSLQMMVLDMQAR